MTSTTTAALEPGDDLALVRFDGADATTFLQGYLTCDLDRLTDRIAVPTALCNLKGRVIVNGWVFTGALAEPDAPGLSVLCHHSCADVLLAALEKYLVFARTTASRSAERFALGASAAASGHETAVDLGDGLALVLEQSPAENPTMDPALDQAAGPAPAFWQTLTEAGRVLVDATSSGEFLPQMLALPEWSAVDFDKGCYLGQEVVARAQHRGAVKRALCHLRLAAATAPASGPGHAPVNAAPAAPAGEPGARLGQLVQRAGAHALAVLKAPFPAAQTPVEIGLSTETVTAFVLS